MPCGPLPRNDPRPRWAAQPFNRRRACRFLISSFFFAVCAVRLARTGPGAPCQAAGLWSGDRSPCPNRPYCTGRLFSSFFAFWRKISLCRTHCRVEQQDCGDRFLGRLVFLRSGGFRVSLASAFRLPATTWICACRAEGTDTTDETDGLRSPRRRILRPPAVSVPREQWLSWAISQPSPRLRPATARQDDENRLVAAETDPGAPASLPEAGQASRARPTFTPRLRAPEPRRAPPSGRSRPRSPALARSGAPSGSALGSFEASLSTDYAPFGATVKATGSAAADNPWRFSTKYHAGETKLVSYGYRY